MRATSDAFKKLSKLNIHAMGENSPNLVTLHLNNIKTFTVD
jgi:hypothetical protein